MILVRKRSRIRLQASYEFTLRRNERRVEAAIQRWFAAIRRQIYTDLTSRFAKDITSEVIDWESIEEQGVVLLRPEIAEAYRGGGAKGYKIMGAKDFDVLNADTAARVDKMTAKMVREVSAKTREGIRVAIKDGIKAGRSMDKVARDIRPLVGLTRGQTESILNFKVRLKEKRPDLSTKDINRRTRVYSDRTKRRRARTIARTETADVQNAGYIDSLDELGVVEAEFSVSPSEVCPICESMDGNIYPIKEARNVITVHPNCRCAMLPIVGGKTVSKLELDPDQRATHITELLEKLGQITDSQEKKRIRRALRKLGHKGGMTGSTPPTVPVAPKLPPVPGVEPATGVEVLWNAANLGKAEANARRILGIKGKGVVDYTKMPLNLANKTNKGLWEMKQKFPDLKIERIYPTSNDVLMQVNYVRGGKGNTLEYSTSFFKSEKRALADIARMHKNNYLVADSVEGIVHHEMGHALTNSHLVKRYGQGMARQEVQRLDSIKFSRKGLSKYGTKDGGEGVAEAFSKYMQTGSIDSITKANGQSIHKLMKTYTGREFPKMKPAGYVKPKPKVKPKVKPTTTEKPELTPSLKGVPSRATEGPLKDWEAYHKKYQGTKPDKLVRYQYLEQLPKESLNEKQVKFLSKYKEFWADGRHRSVNPFRDWEEWVKKLNSREWEAIKSWKAGSYNLRKYQLGQVTVKGLDAQAVGLGTDVRWGGKHIANAFSRAPNYQGTVFRGTGVYDDIKGLKVGKKIEWNANYATSKKETVANVFLKEGGENPVLFEIKTKTAVDLANVSEAYVSQQEVVTRIGSEYLVKEVKKVKDGMLTYTRVVLEEVK